MAIAAPVCAVLGSMINLEGKYACIVTWIKSNLDFAFDSVAPEGNDPTGRRTLA